MKVTKENQTSFLEEVPKPESSAKKKWTLSVDGASRGNPGVAGIGIYIADGNTDVIKVGFKLGKHTNNEAEYLALLVGVLLLKEKIDCKKDSLLVISDSQLLIRQMQGIYKVKKPELQKINQAVWDQLGALKCTFKHVEREYNTVADMLANQGIDTKHLLPSTLLTVLRNYEIL